LPDGIGQQMVTVVIQWMGQNSEGRNINHTIDILTTPTKGSYYHDHITYHHCLVN
jgi:hypothetical protein